MTPKNIDEIIEAFEEEFRTQDDGLDSGVTLRHGQWASCQAFLRSALKSHTAYILEQLPEESDAAALGEHRYANGYDKALADVREKITKLIE